jgi:hypothetical protein
MTSYSSQLFQRPLEIQELRDMNLDEAHHSVFLTDGLEDGGKPLVQTNPLK